MRLLAYTFTLLLVLFQFSAVAQGIRGSIKNHKGEALPFASVYITNLNNGSSSNANGDFEIKLPAGKHTVMVKYIGYEAQQVQVEISDSWVQHDFRLGEQSFALKEVQVKGKGEDPAYTIMRKAFSKK